MKNSLCLLIFLTLLMPFGVEAQQKVAKIGFSNYVIDIGTVKEDDGVVVKEYDMSNTGDSPLILHKVITSCNCTSIEWPNQPILPGEKSSIRVEFNPKGKSKQFSETITVYSNSETPMVVLQLKGFVKEHEKTLEEKYNRAFGDVRFDRNLISLNRIYMGKTVYDTLSYYNFGSEQIKLSGISQSLGYISIKFEPEIIKPKEMGRMIISFNPDKKGEWGLIVERFSININDKLFSGNFFTLAGTVEEDFSKLTQKQLENSPKIEFDNRTFDFGQVEEGKYAEHEFVFKNVGKSDLIIRKIKASCGCTTVEPAEKVIKPGASSKIKASFKTAGYSGRQSKSITVISNDPRSQAVVLLLSGNVVKSAQ